jgi:CheY-like chemotaxis protein
MPQDTLIMVEDNEEHARLLLQAYERRFPEVCVKLARTGADAFALLESGLLPRAVLLDLLLPDMPGFDVLKRLQRDARWRHIPVVVFTMDESDAAGHAARRLGAAYFQVKPVSRLGFSAFATFLQTWLEWRPESPAG